VCVRCVWVFCRKILFSLSLSKSAAVFLHLQPHADIDHISFEVFSAALSRDTRASDYDSARYHYSSLHTIFYFLHLLIESSHTGLPLSRLAFDCYFLLFFIPPTSHAYRLLQVTRDRRSAQRAAQTRWRVIMIDIFRAIEELLPVTDFLQVFDCQYFEMQRAIFIAVARV